MSQNPKQESILEKDSPPIIFISPEGKVYIVKHDKEILEIMSALNVYDENLKNLIKSNNRAVTFCG